MMLHQLTNCRQPILFSLFPLLFRFVVVIAGQNSNEQGIPFLGVRFGVQKIVPTSNVTILTATSESWFVQKLDHFDRFNSITWRQVNK